MYRDIVIRYRNTFGWEYVFKFGEDFYYAFFMELEQAKQASMRQIDNLYMKIEIYGDSDDE